MRMLKICGDSIYVPLEMILSELFILVCFLLNWQKEILTRKNPKYLFTLIPTRRSLYSAQNMLNIPLVNTKQKLFFQSTITEWNNLDHHLRKFEDFLGFESNIFKSIRPSPNSVYNCHNPTGICLQDLDLG